MSGAMLPLPYMLFVLEEGPRCAHNWDAPQAQTDPNNMICCHTTTLSIHTTVV